MELKKVMDHADAVKESVINHRRKIHTFAELGGKEFKTKKYIFINSFMFNCYPFNV